MKHFQYQKIVVIGSPGAGKTVFTKKLALQLGYPAIHIDDYYWLSNWVRLDNDKWHKQLKKLCKQPLWIMDGNHVKTLDIRLQYSDLVVYLDYSVIFCLYSYIQRSIRRFRGINDQLPLHIVNDKNHQPKFTINWRMINLILGFKFKTRYQILKKINSSHIKLIRLKSRKASNQLLNNLSTNLQRT